MASLDKGANINHRDKYGISALMYAVSESTYDFSIPGSNKNHQEQISRQTKIVRYLLLKGANAGHKDKVGRTALNWATRANLEKTEIIKLLLKYGADPNSKAKSNYSALVASAANGHLNIVNILLKAGATPEIPCPS